MTKTTAGKRKVRKRRKTRKAVKREALEFMENILRMERESIPILQGDYAKLH